MQKSISFQIITWIALEFPTNFWNSVLPVSNCSYSTDQQNAVWSNVVIEELSFH